MELPEDKTPYCHGEPMQPIYRYRKEGLTYITYKCNYAGCHHTEEVLVG